MNKKIIISFAILATSAVHAIIEMTNKATTAAPWNFEIYNKSASTISVSINYEGRMGQILGAPMRIEPSGKLRTALRDTAAPLVVNISTISRKIAKQQFWIVPCPQKNACENTMFLTYDENGLRPQTGILLGIPGITDSGLSLKNNIDQRYIFSHLSEFLQFKENMYSKDYYAILGVSKNASTAEITKAYRSLILKWHPDKNLNNQEEATVKSKEINTAYAILKDPSKRAKYDAKLDAYDSAKRYYR